MSRKRILITLLTLISIAGITGLCIPLIQSLSPNASAGALLPRIDISELQNGEYLVQDDPRQGFYKVKYLAIRDYDSKLYIYAVPFHEGKAILPDLAWWRFGASCENFGPDKDGEKIKPNGLIQCQDKIVRICRILQNGNGAITEQILVNTHAT